jgi:hypothetical protein
LRAETVVVIAAPNEIVRPSHAGTVVEQPEELALAKSSGRVPDGAIICAL